jgi:hypothetical protein
MFRTSRVHLPEDYIVHVALYGMLPIRLCKNSFNMVDCLHKRIEKTHHIRLHVQYSLPEDKHEMFEIRSSEHLN